MPEISECIEVAIDRLAHGGDGVGRHEGQVVFVPHTAPGDLIRAAVTEVHPRFLRAKLLDVLRPGPGRREPLCRHAGHCGGCHYQHVVPEVQAAAKLQALEDALKKTGGIVFEGQIAMHRGAEFGYRLRARFEVTETEGQKRLGLRAAGQHSTVAILECPVLVPELQEALPRLWEAAPAGADLQVLAADGGEVLSAAVSKEDEASTRAALPRKATADSGTIRIGEFAFRVKGQSFFQAHRGLLETLHARVLPEEGGTLAFDLFAGVGFFSLPLTKRFTRVFAVESDAVATALAERSANEHDLKNLRCERESVLSFLKRTTKTADFVLLDPPRTGAKSEIEALLQRPPVRIHYLSCDPHTFARDLKRLLAAGYAIERLEAFDLFPQTYHIEAFAALKLVR